TIYGWSYDLPASGPGAGQDTNCGASSPLGFQGSKDNMINGPTSPIVGWPGGSPNVCQVGIEVQDFTAGGGATGGNFWNGASFVGAVSNQVMTTTQTAGALYSYDMALNSGSGLWANLNDNGIYRLRIFGKDAAMNSATGWNPNVEGSFGD